MLSDCQTPLTKFCTAYGVGVVPNKFGTNVAQDGMTLPVYDRRCQAAAEADRVNPVDVPVTVGISQG